MGSRLHGNDVPAAAHPTIGIPASEPESRGGEVKLDGAPLLPIHG